MLAIHRSNRLEALADALTALLEKPLARPLQPELIVAPSSGMRRWAQHAIAERSGIAMNIDFVLPAQLARRAFEAGLEANEDSGFSPEILPWRALAAFPELLPRPEFTQLRAYAAGENEPLKRYQLARKIADVFARYLAYRPHWLMQWPAAQRQSWQATLWQHLANGRQHPPAQLAQLRDRLADDPDVLDALPERIAIFGLSSLAPFHLQLLDTVARVRDVHLFLLEPTDLYWGEIRDSREQTRFLKRHAKPRQTAADFHLETGHPLLASLGKVGRDCAQLVQELDPAQIEEAFEPSAGTTLLGKVQSDVFAMHERPQEEREQIDPRDRSIQVHCCHSAMREVEVLHDQLLALFESLPDLEPRDILVAMPDIESYAPLIEAVFGAPEDEGHRMPFTIADRPLRAESSVAEAFLRVLDLRGGRFGSATVFAILEAPAVRVRFDLVEGDLETLRVWIDRVGIRWGIDAEHRSSLDLPAFPANTWRHGFRRLLLGYALPGDEQSLFGDILPVREVEGDLALKLGQFIDFAETLFSLVPRLEAPRLFSEWSPSLTAMIDALFSDDDDFADEVQALRRTCSALQAIERASGLSEPVAFEVVRAHLTSALEETEGGAGFLGGGLTFCALKPLRSIPFRALCLLGMSDTAFPRQDRPLSFDLVGLQLQPGDRSLREDDRYLFLEAILSAREVLYLSYPGLSTRDQTESPPSTCVSELLDYLGKNFALADGDLRKDLVVTKHRLQPFSAAYFRGDPHLFSYSAQNARAGQTTSGERHAARRFCDAPLPAVEAGTGEVTLDQLLDFFCQPSRFFARQRLGLRFPEGASPLLEQEPLELGKLDETRFRGELTDLQLQGLDAAASLALLQADGQLPHGTMGAARHRELYADAAEIVGKIRPWLAPPALPPLPVDLHLDGWHLTGSLDELRPAAQVRHRAAKLKPKDRIRAWLRHLVLNAARTDGYPERTLLFATDDDLAFMPLSPDAPLRDLLALYSLAAREPLPFFPESSWLFAEAIGRGRQPAAALEAARFKWDTGFWPGENENPYHTLCFRGVSDPLDARWAEIALKIYGPMRAAETAIAP